MREIRSLKEMLKRLRTYSMSIVNLRSISNAKELRMKKATASN
jgi:hypothetical protein